MFLEIVVPKDFPNGFKGPNMFRMTVFENFSSEQTLQSFSLRETLAQEISFFVANYFLFPFLGCSVLHVQYQMNEVASVELSGFPQKSSGKAF